MARPGGVSRPLHDCILTALMVAALCLSPEAAGAPSASGGAEARCEENVCLDSSTDLLKLFHVYGDSQSSRSWLSQRCFFQVQLPHEKSSFHFLSVLILCQRIPRGQPHENQQDPNAPKGAFSRVCQDFLERFYSSLKEKHSDFSTASIEEELIKTCMNTKGKENRLCYYPGATEDAATKILTEVSRPMSVHIPVAKICEKLKKGDIQICELKYERQLDLTSVDLSKMRAAELKKILDSWGEVCRACAEKREFVNLIKELAPKHTAPPAKADL